MKLSATQKIDWRFILRKDENGAPCPETLGEYYDLCIRLCGVDNKATKFIQSKIDSSPKGREEVVVTPDSQMRQLIFTMATN